MARKFVAAFHRALLLLRWAIISVGVGFILTGWVHSVTKYVERKTSMRWLLQSYSVFLEQE